MSPVNDCYKLSPLETVDGIPVFSARNLYVDNYEQISQDHLSHLDKTGLNPFMSEEHWMEIESSTEVLLRKNAPSGSRILDVGVGLGRLLEKFPDLQRFGMDISLGYLRRARAKGIEVCRSLIEDMPYADGFYDLVVCTDVLEHVIDLNLAFENILRVLKPGGILIVRVPYRENLSGYLAPEYPYEFVHLRSFDEHSFRLFVERIFNRQLVEYTFAGYVYGPLKWDSAPYRIRRLAWRSLEFSKRFGEEQRMKLATWWNRPLEINFVVRNDVLKAGRSIMWKSSTL
jgi:SAM-dependent methyltransferase